MQGIKPAPESGIYQQLSQSLHLVPTQLVQRLHRIQRQPVQQILNAKAPIQQKIAPQHRLPQLRRISLHHTSNMNGQIHVTMRRKNRTYQRRNICQIGYKHHNISWLSAGVRTQPAHKLFTQHLKLTQYRMAGMHLNRVILRLQPKAMFLRLYQMQHIML